MLSSRIFFKDRLPISYSLFNKLFRSYILNKNIDHDEMKAFHENGFVKLDINLQPELDKFKEKIKLPKHTPDEKKVWFYLESKDKKDLELALIEKLKKKIDIISKYFNSDINFANMRIYRIMHSENDDKEIYADRFHQDGYLMNYIKIHINMMDVTTNDGPMNIVSLKDKENFFNLSNYKDRTDYNKEFDSNLIHRNIGNYGDCFLFSSPQCFHRAEIPSKFRDMMQLIFVATPKNYDLKKLNEIKHVKNEENYKLILYSKPYTLLTMSKTFMSFFAAKN